MSTVILDHCTGDADPIDGRIPDTTNTPGGTWSDPNGGFITAMDRFQAILTGQMVATIEASQSTVALSATVRQNSTAIIGLVLRYADDNNFLLAAIQNSTINHRIFLFKFVGGVSTQLAVHTAAIVVNTDYTLTFSADGNNLLTASVAGTTIQATDAAGSGNTRVGIFSNSSAGIQQWDDFTVSSMPTPILTVADRADGTGATATISGGTSGTNTIYVQPFAPESTWAVGGVRTGDGTVALSLQGYFWAYALGAGATVSNFVPFAATDSARSVQDRMSDAVVARVQQLTMAMNINTRVYNQIIEDDRIAGFPCIFVVFAGENEDDAGGLNDLDDVGYPFRVLIVDRNSENYQVPKGKYLLWRQQIARALRNQRLTTVAESINTKVRYSNIADKRLPQYQYFVSGLKVNCISREVRGLT